MATENKRDMATLAELAEMISTEPMPTDNDYHYPFIRLWENCIFHTDGGYTDRQVRLAQKTGAPKNAIYRESEFLAPELCNPYGFGWATMARVSNPDVYTRMGLPIPQRLRFKLIIDTSMTFSDRDEAQECYEHLQRLLPIPMLSGLKKIINMNEFNPPENAE